MSTSATARPVARQATLKLGGPAGDVLTASVPKDVTDEEFARVSQQALGLIRNLTKCNCLSGRISYVVEENYAEVISVNLNAATQGTAKL